ncbi:MAG: hypothetical protein M5U28_27135 [Sandaracinaceae bacterium]|nr:hypothetical protein [Sandaracinaceae bacterium]
MTTLARAPRGREIAAFATIATASALAASRPLPCLATDDARAPRPSEPPRPEGEREHEEDAPDDELPPAASSDDELPASLASRSLSSLALHYAARFAGADDDESPLHALLEMTFGGPALAAAVDAIAASGLDGPAIADALLDGLEYLHHGVDAAQRAEVYAFLDAAATVVRAGAEGAPSRRSRTAAPPHPTWARCTSRS